MKEYINKVIKVLWPHRHFIGGSLAGNIFNFIFFGWELALSVFLFLIVVLILFILYKVE